MRISDWSSDVCSSDLLKIAALAREAGHEPKAQPYPAVSRCLSSRHNTPHHRGAWRIPPASDGSVGNRRLQLAQRSEEHTSELQSLMRISYAVFCLKKKKHRKKTHRTCQPNTTNQKQVNHKNNNDRHHTTHT